MSKSVKTSQKEIIVELILRKVGNRYDPHDQVRLSSEDKRDLQDELVRGFKNGSIPCKRDKTKHTDLHYYAGNIISEWLRKDKRLNGGKRYTARPNPKTIYEPFAEEHFRNDEQLNAMILLRSVFTTRLNADLQHKKDNLEKVEQINKQIKKRIQDLVLARYGVNIRNLPVDLLAALDMIPPDDQAA